MPKKRQSIPNLPKLISTTVKLRRDLEALLRRHDESHLTLGDQIFVRFLNPVWRNLYGAPYRPDQQKELESAAWIGRFGQYLQDLKGCIVNVMLRPDLFQALPWNYYVQCSADECIRRFRLQERALATIQEGDVSPSGSTPGKADLSGFLRRLKPVVDQRGLNYCAHTSGVNRDTIADMLQGRTGNPQKRTVEKLEKFVANEAANSHGRN